MNRTKDKPTSCYTLEKGSVIYGVIFRTPTKTRYIPNAWLIQADLLDEGSTLYLLYSQSTVTIRGKELLPLLESLQQNVIKTIQEGTGEDELRVDRIDIEEREEQ